MRVLLLNPPGTEFIGSGTTSPPLGLLYLSSELLRSGIEVDVIDGCVERIRFNKEYDVVGITSMTPARWRAFDLVSEVRKKMPKAKIVMGGAHPSVCGKQILDNFEVDACCAGEGEGWLLQYVTGGTSKKMYYKNLDDIAFPAWDLVDFERYGRGKARVEFSRGCPATCNFCSSWHIWPSYRVRSPENMVDELLHLRKTYDVTYFNFVDDIMTVNREATLGLCEEIIRQDELEDIVWTGTTRADAVDREMLNLMAKSGCISLSYGVESGHPDMITAVHKSREDSQKYIDTCEKTIKETQECGIAACALMMVGNPSESEETIQTSLDFLRRAKPKKVGCVGGVWLLPATALYQKAKREGIIDDSFWLERKPLMIYPCSKAKKWQRKLYSYDRYIYWRHVLAKPYPRAWVERQLVALKNKYIDFKRLGVISGILGKKIK